jgi:hypothetical protein
MDGGFMTVRMISSLVFMVVCLVSCGQMTTDQATVGEDAYLFSSFRGNGEDGLHLAYSYDGLQWTSLNGDQSFLTPEVGHGLMRDPSIVHGPDGMFHMVWTSGWHDQGIGVAHSEDLIHWSQQTFVPVMEHEPAARNAWAPEIFWDPKARHYVIYWASTVPGRFSESVKAADKGWNHRIYYTTTKDFRQYTDTKLFYEPGFNVIDSVVVRKGDEYIMVSKDETRYPPAKNLLVAKSTEITGPWGNVSEPFTPAGVWVEGPTILEVEGWYIVYYDEYINKQYGALRTRDFNHWENISNLIQFPEGTRHGTAFRVPHNVLDKLLTVKQ